VHDGVISLIPTPAARRQGGRLFERSKTEETDVELVASLLVTLPNCELHVFERPRHGGTSGKMGDALNVVVFYEPWDH
jgi:hypothetical protein